MRLVAPLLLLACTTDPSDRSAVSIDPRQDPVTWPEVVGGDRPAALHAPSVHDGASLLPLVVVLHGYGANGALQNAYFGLSARVEDRGMVVVLPDGTVDGSNRRFWNATDACCDFGGTGVDDVSYLLGLVDEVEASLPIDPDRVTFIGHSNGGFMAHRLACEAPDRIAGILSLAGASFAQASACTGSGSTSVLQVHGTNDTTILFEGGELAGGPAYPSARVGVERWAERAGCGAPVEQGWSSFDNAVQGEETRRERWQHCEEDRNVALWTMQGSGHLPGVNQDFREAIADWLLAVRR